MSRKKRRILRLQHRPSKFYSKTVKNPAESDCIQEKLTGHSTSAHDVSSSIKEYEMMRAEILQYLEEYQSVRNMMYLATASILGLNSAMFQNYYLFLLPLIVILPSYITFYDYWKSVSCASTYIQVFLDDEAVQTTYHWELRHRYFGELHKVYKKRLPDKLRGLDMHCHQIPYFICSCLCLVLYWINMLWKYIRPHVQTTLGETWSVCLEVFKFHFCTPEGRCLVTSWRALFDVLLGVVLIALFICIFIIYWNVDTVKMTRTWKSVKSLGMHEEGELRKELGLDTGEDSSKKVTESPN